MDVISIENDSEIHCIEVVFLLDQGGRLVVKVFFQKIQEVKQVKAVFKCIFAFVLLRKKNT